MNRDKMTLVARLEGHEDIINQACILKNEDGVLSICNDKTIRIWLRRERGSYWPSVCHLLQHVPSCFHFDQDVNRLFVGLEGGIISEFSVTDDFNRIEHKNYFSSHENRVTGILFSNICQWLLSVSRDKQFHLVDSQTGSRRNCYSFESACTAVQFDAQSKYAFIAEQNGQVTMLRLEQDCTCKLITTLHGHQSSIRDLLWEPINKWLFSAGSDHRIICWDIGGRKGSAYELQGHKARVTTLCYSKLKNKLLSGGEDCTIIEWDMSAKRIETPQWQDSDSCQRCNKPFFWNLKAIYENKVIGNRQHHCRYCGKAVCGSCSEQNSTIPMMGFEFSVRICADCFSLLTEEAKKPLAKIYDAHHHVSWMDLDEDKGLVLTAGYDRTMALCTF